MKKINNVEYLKSDDFKICKEFVFKYRELKLQQMKNKHSDSVIYPLKNEYDLISYFKNFNVPFYDIVLYTLYEKENKNYIDLESLTEQMNIFLKNIFLRKFWDPSFPDNFTKFIWDNYKNNQLNNEFDELEKIAFKIYNECDTISCFLKKFIYNTDYYYITMDNMNEMLSALVDVGLLEYDNDYYLSFYLNDLSNMLEDNYEKNNEGFYAEAAHHIFYKKINPKLQKLSTKFKPIPIQAVQENLKDTIRGHFMLFKIDKKYCFIPQFLVFQ